MNPNKVLFHIFLGMAMNIFDDLRKQECEAYDKKLAELKPDSESLKVFMLKQDAFKQEYESLKKLHSRVKDVNSFVIRKGNKEMGPAAADHMFSVSVFLNQMIENVKSTKDYPKILALVDMFNKGEFNDAFAVLDKDKPSIELLTKTNEENASN